MKMLLARINRCSLAKNQQIRCRFASRARFLPSPQQLEIVEHFRDHNVQVSARPGSGKTSTARAVVEADPHIPTLVVTYSKRLQLDTNQVFESYKNVDVLTFHGLAGQLFGTVVPNDKILQKHLKAGGTLWNSTLYERIILDEVQDMTPDLFWLSRYFIENLTLARGKAPRIMVLGDARQTVFQYNKADSRFFELAPTFFPSPYSWVTTSLPNSFRLTHQNTNLINHGFLSGEVYIKGSHDGPQPLYIHSGKSQEDYNNLAQELSGYIREYGPRNSAILAPSVRLGWEIQPLSNSLGLRWNIPIAVPTSDETRLEPKVLNNKLAVSTFHQFKGLERDLVIILGLDEGYFRYMARNLPDDRCSNAIFVAITRARKKLVIVQWTERSALPFVDQKAIAEYCEYKNVGNGVIPPQKPPGRPLRLDLELPPRIAVSEITRLVPQEFISDLISKHVKIIIKPTKLDRIPSPNTVCTNRTLKHHEAISDITGSSIFEYFEWELWKASQDGRLTLHNQAEIGERFWTLNETKPKGKLFGMLALKKDGQRSGYLTRIKQMKSHHFKWMDVILERATRRLKKRFEHLLGNRPGTASLSQSGKTLLMTEAELRTNLSVADEMNVVQTTEILGVADMIEQDTDGNITIWEFKFTFELTDDHIFQAIIYGYLWALLKDHEHIPKVILYNIRDGKEIEIQSTKEGVRQLLEGILRKKYTHDAEMTTEEMLDMCRDIEEKVKQNIARIANHNRSSQIE